ncbi:MAG: response regulator [Opitutaceae bacterium]|nr:response regulator [Opitutaceae bacterium]MBP9912107.1 response regulator [Opitutaceae bacterium]
MIPAKILIVDDTPANLSLVLDTLSEAGHELLVAESGASALALLKHTTPDLILLDAVMPGQDGFMICKIIKNQPAWRSIPVLFMTALDTPEEKLRAFGAGAVDYILKPVHPAEVLARVNTHLQIRALQRSLEEELAMRIEAENELRQSLDRAVVLIDATGHIVFSTHLAEAMLHKHFPDHTQGQLPMGLKQQDSPLIVRRFAERGRDDLALLVLEEPDARPGPAALMQLGLTAREAEVLYWVAQGKSNPDIATILGAGVRTVHKHVENIFRKLGLETRNAATLTALDILRPPAH